MKPLTRKERQRLEISPANIALIMGKRIEICGKGFIAYAGQSTSSRDDPFWYEHPGGRTYKRTAIDVLLALLPHVGFAAIEHAKVHAS